MPTSFIPCSTSVCAAFEIEVSKVSMKLRIGFAPERGVACFEEYSLGARSVMCQHKLFVDDVTIFRNLNHLASPISTSSGNDSTFAAPSMKCAGASTCVPVCAPKLSIETFAPSPAGQAAPVGNLHAGIAGPGRQLIRNGNGHVVNRHRRIVVSVIGVSI